MPETWIKKGENIETTKTEVSTETKAYLLRQKARLENRLAVIDAKLDLLKEE